MGPIISKILSLSVTDVTSPTVVVSLFLLVASLVLLVFIRKFNRKLFSRTVLVLSIGVFIALSLHFYKFTVDDTYISLRYARNLANGHGLVYNTDGSPPVEGYTNFLWVVLESPLFLLDLPDAHILHFIKLISIAFSIGTIVITYRLTALLTQNERAGLLAGLFTASFPYLSFWAVGGLETPMYIFWMMTGLYTYVVEDRAGKMHVWSMVFFALMALTRPEGLFFIMIILFWQGAWLTAGLFLKNKSEIWSETKRLIPEIAVFALLYGIYFLWRYNFYGFLLPNTFYAKSGSLDIEQVRQRFAEMWPFFAYLIPIIALAVVGYIKCSLGRKHEKMFLTAMLIALFAFCFASKREWMPGFRYELPFIPILILFFAACINLLLFHWGKFGTDRKYSIVKLVLLLCIGIYLLHPTIELQEEKQYTDRLDKFHVALGKWLKNHAPPNASYAGWDMGAVPYYSQLPQMIETHPEGILSTYITHKGYDIEHLLSLNPSFITLPYSPNPRATVWNKDSPRKFYCHKSFWRDYQHLFTFGWEGKPKYMVYKRRNVYISQQAFNEGKKLAAQSYH